MVKITVYQNSNQEYVGFDSYDHAGYDDDGHDIVCAAVSALTINCINSIEVLTGVPAETESSEEEASIRFRLLGSPTKQSQLLLASYVLGLQSIEEDYGNFLDLVIEEV